MAYKKNIQNDRAIFLYLAKYLSSYHILYPNIITACIVFELHYKMLLNAMQLGKLFLEIKSPN